MADILIVSREDVKKFLRIDGADQDELIDLYLPAATSIIKEYLNTDYEKAEDVPSGLKLPASMLIGYYLNVAVKQGVQSESIGDYSVNYLTDIPAHIKAVLNPFKRIRVI